MKRVYKYWLVFITGCCMRAQVHAQYPGQHQGMIAVPLKVPVKAYSFDLRDVRLLNSPFKENMERDGRWLLSLEVDRLLHSFRVNAGMRTQAKALGGWEALDMELRGHSTGHFMSALAMIYAATGDPVYKQKGDSLVTGLAQVQEVLNQNGYLSAFPQHFIDRCIAGEYVWAPWYTLHKIMAGLIDMYWYAGNQQALEVAEKMAAWAYGRLKVLTPQQLSTMLRNESGGMNEAFYNLYSITGNPQDLELAQMFYHHAVMDPLAAQEDRLKGLHANTTIPKVTGEARGYELTGDPKDSTIATYFWQTVIRTQTFAIGSNSDKEHFVEPGHLAEHLSAYDGESCNTYNMLKLTRHLFCWTANEQYADYYEQALYNHILASQDPATGMFCYFMPMKPGVFKLYSNHDHSFWCCMGTGSENHTKYGEGIYYHDRDGIYINLFIPSVLTWREKGITLRQETRYPESDTTRLTIGTASPSELSLYLRYPSWARSGAFIKVNGKKIKIRQQPGSYITLHRKWKSGDRVEIVYPMSLRLVSTPNDSTKAAIAYGPVVLAGEMGTEGMQRPEPYAAPDAPYTYYNYDYHIPDGIIDTLRMQRNNINDWIQPVADAAPLTFITVNATRSKPVTLVPYYRLHHQRYVVYWDIEGKN